MKLLVFISICVSICQTAAVSTEVKTKMPAKLANAIPQSQKPELFYSQGNQQAHSDYMPVQLMQKPVFVAPQQPQTMLIIAQPAYVPQNVLYGGQPSMQQQLLHYFHNNPQAKYQLLYGGYQPQPTAQPYLAHHNPLGASTAPAYQVVPSPVFHGGYNHLVAAPSQLAFSQASPFHANHIGGQFVQPLQLNQFAQLAQMGGHQFSAPIRSAPPIITGFENFTPEQQAQIKAHLGSHLGAPLSTASTLPSSTNQYASQLTTQPSQSMSSNDYMPSQDKNAPQPTSTSFTPSMLYRAQYTKG